MNIDYDKLRTLPQDEQIREMRRILIAGGFDAVDAESEEFANFVDKHKERIIEMSLNGELDKE